MELFLEDRKHRPGDTALRSRKYQSGLYCFWNCVIHYTVNSFTEFHAIPLFPGVTLTSLGMLELCVMK
jgi:hypothetical protein